jgi:aspartyl-tRNA(Asn)/glutamyl-tRNA(Gln) amidotransferase subunit A
MSNLLDQPLSVISASLVEGKIKARTLVEVAQARHDPSLNAYRSWAPDFARRQADAADAAFAAGNRLGALQGIPVSVKDIYGVEGLPVFAGSPRELPARFRQEGAIVQRLRRQLAVIMGKSHTVEFAFGGLGVNAHWPVPRNPQDRQVHRSPGGSSSGAGVTLGEGTALVAFGTDTGGSVRIPASVTGTVGVKTTKGRWPTDGIVPLSPTFDTAGTLTRSAADAAFVFESIDGETVPILDDLAGIRLAVAERFFWEGTDPGVTERVEEALQLAAAAGAARHDLALPGAVEVYELYQRGGIVSAELYSFLSSDLPDWIATLDPRVRKRMEAAAQGALRRAWRGCCGSAAGGRCAGVPDGADLAAGDGGDHRRRCLSQDQSAHAAQHLRRQLPRIVCGDSAGGSRPARHAGRHAARRAAGQRGPAAGDCGRLRAAAKGKGRVGRLVPGSIEVTER